MKQIHIRVDGNEIIATGHVMRCLSIAEQLRKLGAQVTFVLADDRPRELIEHRGFLVDVLDTVWDDLDQEIDIFQNYIKENGVKVVLLDSYYVTLKYMQTIANLTKLIYIDDLSRFLYPASTLVSYGAFIDEKIYKEPYMLQKLDTTFLLGSQYVPLRDEFSYVPFKVGNEVRKVLITTGGTDQFNVAGKILKRLQNDEECHNLEYHVIVGCFNKNRDKLSNMKQKYSNIHLHENVTNISEWMRECDVAISAAGTTTYELCACGIPSICLEVADNQEGAIRWEQEGYMKYAGNAYKDMESCIERCRKALIEYRNNYEERLKVSKRMQSLVDGCGACRIAKHIVNEMGED